MWWLVFWWVFVFGSWCGSCFVWCWLCWLCFWLVGYCVVRLLIVCWDVCLWSLVWFGWLILVGFVLRLFGLVSSWSGSFFLCNVVWRFLSCWCWFVCLVILCWLLGGCCCCRCCGLVRGLVCWGCWWFVWFNCCWFRLGRFLMWLVSWLCWVCYWFDCLCGFWCWFGGSCWGCCCWVGSFLDSFI